MIPARLVLATANRGKLAELRALVRAWGKVDVLGLDRFRSVRLPVETGAAYLENAVSKARGVAAATGLPALADDSGLEVTALGGEPGVRSARWAGPDATDAERVAKLLGALAGVPESQRRARFRCVVALAWEDGALETAEGVCAGRIAFLPEGREGFGYDPVFIADDLGISLGLATPQEKDRVSHRAQAVRRLGARLGAAPVSVAGR